MNAGEQLAAMLYWNFETGGRRWLPEQKMAKWLVSDTGYYIYNGTTSSLKRIPYFDPQKTSIHFRYYKYRFMP